MSTKAFTVMFYMYVDRTTVCIIGINIIPMYLPILGNDSILSIIENKL